ncbi:MAG: DUF2029 domain-containing protein [Chloroflexi bacterium]|nr:DUF2029 domain-containing protein [Chloroflexota bacterium]
MKIFQNHIPRWVLVVLLILGISLCLVWLWQISFSTNIGSGDFIGYWSATHLFVSGENPYDPALMGMVQREIETGWDVTIMVWNPPLLFVFLLPLGWMSFQVAKFIWMVANVAMILGSSLMLAELYLPNDRPEIRLLFFLFSVCLPQVISGLFMGQVTFLVFFGLTVSLFLLNKGRVFWAGAALALTLIKPHLVILSLVYLLIYMARKRQFAGWFGLMTVGTACMLVLFVFRLEWIQDLLEQMKSNPTNWFTPTLGGLVSYLGISESLRYMILLFLPLPLYLAWYRPEIDSNRVVAFLTLLTVPLTFFGWSFDQVILLIPIAQVFAWVGFLEKRLLKVWLTASILIALIVAILYRLSSRNDVFQIWFPFFLWLIYFAAWRLSQTAMPKAVLSDERRSA